MEVVEFELQICRNTSNNQKKTFGIRKKDEQSTGLKLAFISLFL